MKLTACSVAAGEGVLWVAGCPFIDRLSTGPGPLRKLAVRLVPFQRPKSAETITVRAARHGGRGGLRSGSSATPSTGGSSASIRGAARSEERPCSRSHPAVIAAGEGGVWVTGSIDDVVARLDPRDGRRLQVIHVGRGASGVAVGAGAVWVASALDQRGLENRSRLREGRRADPRRRLAARGRGRCGRRLGDGRCRLGGPSRPVAVAVLMTVAAGCGSEEQPVRIGVLADCQGALRSYGDAQLSGAELPFLRRGARLLGTSPSDGVSDIELGGRRVRARPRLPGDRRARRLHRGGAPAPRSRARRRRPGGLLGRHARPGAPLSRCGLREHVLGRAGSDPAAARDATSSASRPTTRSRRRGSARTPTTYSAGAGRRSSRGTTIPVGRGRPRSPPSSARSGARWSRPRTRARRTPSLAR